MTEPRKLSEQQVKEIFCQRREGLEPNSEEWIREVIKEEIWLEFGRMRMPRRIMDVR